MKNFKSIFAILLSLTVHAPLEYEYADPINHKGLKMHFWIESAAGKLSGRNYVNGDQKFFKELRTNPGVYENYANGSIPSDTEMNWFINRSIERWEDGYCSGSFIITLEETPIGHMAIGTGRDNGSSEIAYFIHSNFQNKKIMTSLLPIIFEFMKLIIPNQNAETILPSAYASYNLYDSPKKPLTQFEATSSVDNYPSISLLKKLDFEPAKHALKEDQTIALAVKPAHSIEFYANLKKLLIEFYEQHREFEKNVRYSVISSTENAIIGTVSLKIDLNESNREKLNGPIFKFHWELSVEKIKEKFASSAQK